MPAELSRVGFVTSEYRRTDPAVDAATLTKDPLATELVFTTLIDSETDAETFRNDVLALRKISRFDWMALIKRDTYSFQLGDTITLTYPRFGFTGSANFIIKRVRQDFRSPYVEVTLFGPQ